MRKLLISLLAIAFLFGVASSFAEPVYNRSGYESIKITGTDKVANITALSAISVDNRIIGVTYSNSAASSVGVYDTTSTSEATISGLAPIAELYVAAGTVETIILPLPYKVTAGIVVDMADSTGAVTVYYE